MKVPAPCARAESHYIVAHLGLSPGVGDGTGTWLLEVRTDAQAAPDIEVRAFARSALRPRPDERRRALRPVPRAHSSGGGGRTVSTTVVYILHRLSHFGHNAVENPGNVVSTRKDSASHWREMPFKLGATAAEKAAIGLITLANDLSIEPEIIRFLPRDGVALYSNRIPFPDAATPETLAAMERDISRVTALINPGEKLDVVIFGCTSGTMTIGDAVVRDRILEARPDVLTTDPITAGLAGLKALGCKRIALLTPYIDKVNQIVEAFVSSKGMDIGACGSFKRESSAEVCRISPESFLEAGLILGREAVDGLFISCTAVQVSSIIEQLEVELGKPVVSSNQALAWHSMRLAGCNESVPGYGRLLRS